MKVLVFGGSGQIGSAITWDLVQHEDVEAVGIVGRREEALQHTKQWIHSDKVIPHPLDILDQRATTALMKGYGVGVLALPDRRTSYALVEAAIEARLDTVDILEEYHRRPDDYETEGLQLPPGMTAVEYGDWLHHKAIERDVLLLDGMGFAPGLSNITLGEGIRKLAQARSAIARVGGIPAKKAASHHPLRYMITWAFDHVLREYMVRVKVIKQGRIIEVDALTEQESFRFTQLGKDEGLECAITPGMPSFIHTRPDLQEFAEKTIRWPGHYQAIQVLKESGLLSLEPVPFEGKRIQPRAFTAAVLGPRLRPLPGDTDACVMWNTVRGTEEGHDTRIDYYMWDEADAIAGITSMARVTGFSAAIGALIVGRGQIQQKGIVPPEDCIVGALYDAFLEELQARNIIIREVVTTDG